MKLPFFKHHCRCTKCQRRVRLNRHPEEYRTTKPCLWCGGKLRVDTYRMSKERNVIRANTCTCHNYHFPHARGRGWCQYNTKLSDEDLAHMQEALQQQWRAQRR